MEPTKNPYKIFSNIVPQEQTREIQRQTLNILSDALAKSFGPKGSVTAITSFMGQSENSNIKVTHSKDGHTIVKAIQFVNPIERSVQELITNLTHYIVKEVGDGTTSAVILCSTLFDALCKSSESNISLADYMRELSNVIEEVKHRITEHGRPCTLEDVYNICLISTNGNEEISQSLYHVYEKFGIDAYIDIGISSQKENIIKEYDGMTLETGFSDYAFINDKSTNSAKIYNPRIYFFTDPIDTVEMLQLFDAILGHNIMPPLTPEGYTKKATFVPTVIMCKRISSDTSAYLQNIIKVMNTHPNTIPLLIIPDIHQDELFADMAYMCGAKVIKKYLNPDMQKADIEKGLAPTVDTVQDFCGYAEEVRADALKTQIIKPKLMFNTDGSYTEEYNALMNFLKTQIEKNISEDAGINKIANAKRRYNSLKGSMIDFLIGGVSLTDREALQASVEDAVLNVRSAVTNGVGYGANYMAFRALHEMLGEPQWSNNEFVHTLYDAYSNMIKILYNGCYTYDASDILEKSIINGCPLNIRTNEYDKKVLTSIRSDIVILDTIQKVLSLMYSTNQYLVPSPAFNFYSQV